MKRHGQCVPSHDPAGSLPAAYCRNAIRLSGVGSAQAGCVEWTTPRLCFDDFTTKLVGTRTYETPTTNNKRTFEDLQNS